MLISALSPVESVGGADKSMNENTVGLMTRLQIRVVVRQRSQT